MKKTIYPCIWFDNLAKEAATLYCSLFENAAITEDTPMVVRFSLNGQEFMGLNGGPEFRPTPAISFYVTLGDESQLEKAWLGLSEGGFILMPLNAYDWSRKYGWVQDRYGVSWQLTLGEVQEAGRQFVPLLMFCGAQQGKAAAAMDYYVSVFGNSQVDFVARYAPGQVQHDATIVHARFHLGDQVLMAMDSAVPQPFTFTEGVSLVITCDTQEEIDYYWDRLTDGGAESMCGWLRDRFGVSWQVVPAILERLMTDPEKAPKATKAFLQMKKFDIAQLLRASEG